MDTVCRSRRIKDAVCNFTDLTLASGKKKKKLRGKFTRTQYEQVSVIGIDKEVN